MKFAQKLVCASLSRYFGVGFSASPKGVKPENAALVCHVRQIGIALHDVDDIKQIVVAGPSRIRGYAGLGDIRVLELELPHDRIGMDAGQPAEQQRIGSHQGLHVGDDRVRIGRGLG